MRWHVITGTIANYPGVITHSADIHQGVTHAQLKFLPMPQITNVVTWATVYMFKPNLTLPQSNQPELETSLWPISVKPLVELSSPSSWVSPQFTPTRSYPNPVPKWTSPQWLINSKARWNFKASYIPTNLEATCHFCAPNHSKPNPCSYPFAQCWLNSYLNPDYSGLLGHFTKLNYSDLCFP